MRIFIYTLAKFRKMERRTRISLSSLRIETSSYRKRGGDWPVGGYANNNSWLARTYPSHPPFCPAPNVPRPISAPPHLSPLPIATAAPRSSPLLPRARETAAGHENTERWRRSAWRGGRRRARKAG